MFYDNYVRFCNSIKKTPSAVALEIGLSKPTVNRWKNGGGITDATAVKVADYFGVSVEELTKEEQKENSPAPSSAGPNKRELLSLVDEYDDDQCANLLEIIKRMKNI